MVHVKKMPGMSDDQVIKLFGRRVTDAQIIPEVKFRRFHLNKQEKKKYAEQEARRLKRKVQSQS